MSSNNQTINVKEQIERIAEEESRRVADLFGFPEHTFVLEYNQSRIEESILKEGEYSAGGSTIISSDSSAIGQYIHQNGHLNFPPSILEQMTSDSSLREVRDVLRHEIIHGYHFQRNQSLSPLTRNNKDLVNFALRSEHYELVARMFNDDLLSHISLEYMAHFANLILTEDHPTPLKFKYDCGPGFLPPEDLLTKTILFTSDEIKDIFKQKNNRDFLRAKRRRSTSLARLLGEALYVPGTEVKVEFTEKDWKTMKYSGNVTWLPPNDPRAYLRKAIQLEVKTLGQRLLMEDPSVYFFRAVAADYKSHQPQ